MSDNLNRPYYPFPNLGNDEARAQLNDEIQNFTDAAIKRSKLLQKARLVRKENADIFREADKVEGIDKFKIFKNLKIGLYPQNFPPLRTQIVAAAGIGKSTTVRKCLEYCKGMVVWIMVPTLILAKEFKVLIEAQTNIKPFLFEGRNQDTCSRHDLATSVGNKGFDVQKTICRIGDNYCPHYDECPYQKQLEYLNEIKQRGLVDDSAQVFVMTHGYLAVNSPLPKPDFVIIDESHWQSLILITDAHDKNKPQNLSIGEMIAFSDPLLEYADEYKNALLSIEEAARKNSITLPLLLRQNTSLSIDKALQHIKEVIKKTDGLNSYPNHPNSKIEAEVYNSKLPRIHLTIRFLECLQHEIKIKKSISTSVIYDDQGSFQLHTLKQNMVSSEIPILLIDASADLAINQCIWGKSLNSIEIKTERNAKISQGTNKTFSKISLGIPYGDSNAWEAPEKTKLFKAELVKFIQNIASEIQGNILVVASKKVIDTLKLSFPSNVMTAHFGNLRGLNHFQSCRAAIIIGREQPNHKAVEALTRALKSFSNDTLLNSQDYVAQARNIRMKDGSIKEALVRIHVDPLAQAVLEQIREQEITQAIDRLRLINDDEAKIIYLLTSVPVDTTVDKLLLWEELSHNSKMDVAIQHSLKKAKAFPLGDRDILLAAPTRLWSTQDAIGSYITRHGGLKWVVSLIRYYIPNDPLLVAEYRCGKRGKWSHAIISGSESDPQAALEKVLGKPVLKFRIIEE